MKINLPPANRATVRLKHLACAATCTLAFALIVNEVNAQSLLLKDINRRENLEDANESRSLTASLNKVFFVNHFNELWQTTGTPRGTVRVKRFRQIGSLKNIGATVYFSADAGSGMELWKSNGTFSGTVKVKEFVSGPAGGNPGLFTEANGMFYFTAFTADQGIELWKSDGTTAGTVLVKDIRPGKGSSEPKGLTFVNGRLYFSAYDGKTGRELWKSNGTTTVLVKDIRPGQNLSSIPQHLTNVNGVLFFVAFESATGRELWKSNGTNEGTVRVSDIRSGPGTPNIASLTSVKRILFFSANDGVHGQELWKYDGSRAVLVKDLTPGPGGSGIRPFGHSFGNLTSVSGLLFFTAYLKSSYYVWRSDGTSSGTIPLELSESGLIDPKPRFVLMGNSIYYFNTPDREIAKYATELRRMNPDGSGSVKIATLVQEDYYQRYAPELVAVNNSLYLWGRNDSGGFKLFKSNGTPGSLISLSNAPENTVGSFPHTMLRASNDQVFFWANNESSYPALWRTDGTAQGTILLHTTDGNQSELAATDTHVYFSGLTGLWKTDGTREGTVAVTSKLPNAIGKLMTVKNMVYFELITGGLGRSDGTDAGTFMLTKSQRILFAEPVGNLLLYLVPIEGTTHVELWRSNGQRSGTHRIRTFPGRQFSYMPHAVKGNIMYFVADDGVSGNEVWRTDGTTAGTFLLADLNKREGDIASLSVWKGHLYISALDDTETWALYKSNGRDVTRMMDMNLLIRMIPTEQKLHLFGSNHHWVTDGTVEGTQLMSEPAFYAGVNVTIVNDVVYFMELGKYLWRSDGTACGTFPIDLGVAPQFALEHTGNRLVFAGYTLQYGSEPYVFNLARAPASPCGTPTHHVAVTDGMASNNSDEMSVTSYPNPFAGEFVINIQGVGSDLIKMEVFTHTGFPVETIKDIAANTEYRLGGSWKPGNYILIVNKSGKITSHQMVKQ